MQGVSPVGVWDMFRNAPRDFVADESRNAPKAKAGLVTRLRSSRSAAALYLKAARFQEPLQPFAECVIFRPAERNSRSHWFLH